MASLSLNCFGVGDGWPCVDRRHSAFLYRSGKSSILLDCGEGVSAGFKASGLGYDAIDGIFLSHLHADHVGGFHMLVQGFWLESRRKPLVVRAPAEGLDPLRRMLGAGYLFDQVLPFRLTFEPLEHGQAVNVGALRLTPFRTSHLEGLRRSCLDIRRKPRFEAFSFLIEGPRRRIGHSADIGAPEDLDPLLRQPLDLLVCELAHCEPEALFRRLRQASIRQVVFIHLARPFWENLSQTRRRIRRGLGSIPFVIAKEGVEVSL